MQRLKAGVDAALGGQGSLVMLVGEPGIGKTRLSQEIGVYARLRGVQVLRGNCHETEAGLPYLPFVEALREYVASKPEDSKAIRLRPICSRSPSLSHCDVDTGTPLQETATSSPAA